MELNPLSGRFTLLLIRCPEGRPGLSIRFENGDKSPQFILSGASGRFIVAPLAGAHSTAAATRSRSAEGSRAVLLVAGNEFWKPPKAKTVESAHDHFCHHILRHFWDGTLGREQ